MAEAKADRAVGVRAHDDVRAVLADPRFVVPAAPADGAPPGSMRWLRQSVARFRNGPVHQRRREVAQGILAALEPDRLRAAARHQARTTPRDAASFIPVAVLGAELGAPAADLTGFVRATRAVAAAYQPGATAEQTAHADAGVRALLAALPHGEPEEAAQRIGLLVQACDATTGLIRNVLKRATPTPPTPGLVTETLRLDPPVRGTRRQALAGAVLAGRPVPEGATVLLDFAAANRDAAVFPDPDRFDPDRRTPGHLTFGSGIRPCPGSAHALALAYGVLDVRRDVLVDVRVEGNDQ